MAQMAFDLKNETESYARAHNGREVNTAPEICDGDVCVFVKYYPNSQSPAQQRVCYAFDTDTLAQAFIDGAAVPQALPLRAGGKCELGWQKLPGAEARTLIAKPIEGTYTPLALPARPAM